MAVVFWLALGVFFVWGFRTTLSAMGGNLQGRPEALRAGLFLLGVAGLIGLVGYLAAVPGTR